MRMLGSTVRARRQLVVEPIRSEASRHQPSADRSAVRSHAISATTAAQHALHSPRVARKMAPPGLDRHALARTSPQSFSSHRERSKCEAARYSYPRGPLPLRRPPRIKCSDLTYGTSKSVQRSDLQGHLASPQHRELVAEEEPDLESARKTRAIRRIPTARRAMPSSLPAWCSRPRVGRRHRRRRSSRALSTRALAYDARRRDSHSRRGGL